MSARAEIENTLRYLDTLVADGGRWRLASRRGERDPVRAPAAGA